MEAYEGLSDELKETIKKTVQDLLNQYAELTNQITTLEDQRGGCFNKLVALADKFAPDEPTVNLPGFDMVATITRRMNITYKDKEVLSKLIEQYPELVPLYRMSVSEAGTNGNRVDEFIAQNPGHAATPIILANRVKKPGKPGFEVKVR